MIKVMFVCLGNICRSPMAEFVLKDMVKKMGKENEFLIKSSATSFEEIGNDVHYGIVKKLNSVGVPVEHREATRLSPNDYDKYDSNNPRDIADPWYTGNFDKTYEDILEGCRTFLEKVIS